MHINVLSYTNLPLLISTHLPPLSSSHTIPLSSTLPQPHPVPAEIKAQGYFTTMNRNTPESQQSLKPDSWLSTKVSFHSFHPPFSPYKPFPFTHKGGSFACLSFRASFL